jgi:hypothetical protein
MNDCLTLGSSVSTRLDQTQKAKPTCMGVVHDTKTGGFLEQAAVRAPSILPGCGCFVTILFVSVVFR